MILLRIALSPFIFLYSFILLAAWTLFPLPLLIMMSLEGIFLTLLYSILNYTGLQLSTEENEWISATKYKFLNHFIGCTFYFWFPFYTVYKYIFNAEIINDFKLFRQKS